MADDKTIPALTEVEQARWAAARSSIAALRHEASREELSEESIEATFNQLGQLNLDTQKFLNALHIPDDADVYREALTAILLRIPDGWGRWISCDAGWYPILVELDQALAKLSPDYVVEQVKEKYLGMFGTTSSTGTLYKY